MRKQEKEYIDYKQTTRGGIYLYNLGLALLLVLVQNGTFEDHKQTNNDQKAQRLKRKRGKEERKKEEGEERKEREKGRGGKWMWMVL